MYNAGYNARQINSDPFNGRGSYSVVHEMAASWYLAAVSVATAGTLLWSVREAVSRDLTPSWTVRARMEKLFALGWSVRLAVGNSFSTLWYLTGGVIKHNHIHWSLRFAGRRGSLLTAGATSSALIRHTATSALKD